MDKRMEDLLNYERRVIEDRMQLSKLMEESDVKDTQFMKEKLEFFRQEIGYLNRQVEFLKCDMERRESPAGALGQGMPSQVPSYAQRQTFMPEMEQMSQRAYGNERMPEMEATPQRAYGNERMPGMEPMPQRAYGNQGIPGMEPMPQRAYENEEFYQNERIPEPIPQKIPEKRDMEKAVGKSLMGILASGLIFISLILFATLLLPYFNDTAKMLTTYVISFGFTAIGLIKLKKDKENKFYVALSGCGIGAIYISLLLSNMYFKAIGDITLYFLICLWGVGVCFLSRLGNKVFQIIGELGILISVIFGCLLCDQERDELKFLVLIIYYIISSMLFYFAHYKKEFNENVVHHIFNAINCSVLVIASSDIIRADMHVSLVFLLILVLLSVCGAFVHQLEKSNVSFGIFTGIYICMMFGMVYRIVDTELSYAIIGYILFVVFMLVLQFKKVNGNAGKNIIYLVLTVMAITALNSYEHLYEYGVLPMLVAPLLLLGFYNKNSVSKYSSLVLLFFYTFDFYPMEEKLHFGLELMAFVLVFYLIYRCKEQYSRVFKCFAYVTALWFLMICIGDMTGDVTTYIVVTVFNIIMLKSCFGKNLLTGERENPALYHIANLAAMIYGMCMLGEYEEPVEHFLLILTVVAAFMVNAKNILDKRDNIFAGMYVGFKFTVLMIFILNSFDAVNYVISIACFIFAILSIVIGFVKDYKSLRIFGLILSMISTFKLIMVDITYDNTLGNALSFFGSGILCFVISLIYNYIDGKVKREE